MFRFAEVIIPLNLPKTLTYGIPLEMQDVLQIGMRVEVALGKNKLYAGVVAAVHNQQPDAFQIKPIKSILENQPSVSEIQLQFWQWIGEYYLASPGEVMQAALPAHLKLAAETRLVWLRPDYEVDWSPEADLAVAALQLKNEISLSELRNIVGVRAFAQVVEELIEKQVVLIKDELEPTYKPKKEKFISLSIAYHKNDEALSKLFDTFAKAPKQEALLLGYLQLSHDNQFVRQQELLERTQISAGVLKTMIEKGVFDMNEIEVDRLYFKQNTSIQEFVLSPAQKLAFESLSECLQHKNVVLLEGVTSSGKTLIYVEKIRVCLREGKQALFLLPEIALTTQLMKRLHGFFGDKLGVYHSRFSNNERIEIWEKVRKGQYQIVVGPRSALWLPFSSLGLIVVDEEHDVSYKQKDPSPRFHARDAAIYLASLHHGKVILGSATPSVESLYNAEQEKYGYVQLLERFQGVEMPTIEIVEAKSAEILKSQGIKMITPKLIEAMTTALQHQKQIILFQNRRGYAPFQLCLVCGWVPQCKNCSVSLTFHKSSDKLHCHYCGLKAAPLHTCASCGSNRLQSKTFGTEKIEEEVKQIFPQAIVARMDVDSMRGKNTINDLLEKIEKRKVDILVGTQMVVKGLDFANVVLVGILNADSLLSFPDFRVNERAFQLMEQVSGRAGRSNGEGKVFIQAYNINHPVLQWVKNHNIRSLYEHEIAFRSHLGYPPFTRLIKIAVKHKDEIKSQKAATELAKALQGINGISVAGPAPALVSRIRNQYIFEVWIKCPKNASIIAQVKQTLQSVQQNLISQRSFGNVVFVFDVDPV
ncbi:MAG: primosomal protein N' [Bacteroidetes bacterium]|nr:primosomal protein N' [Bacteroidota bacterium]MBS1740059.1 primosomal protein N' [Bacteroidota bacterium]